MDLAVIIPYYLGADYIEKCLISMYNDIIPSDLKVIIVNNSQSDLSDILHEYETNITVVTPQSNIGFGRACNLGVFVAILQGAENFIILNQDSYWTKGNFMAFTESLRASKMSILFPMLHEYESMNKSSFIQDHYIPKDIEILKGSVEVIDIENYPGTCVGFHKELYEKLGLFDPIFFFYAEDYDLCQRSKGTYKLNLYPNIQLNHMSGLVDKVVLKESVRDTKYKAAQFLKQVRYQSPYNAFRSFVSSCKSMVFKPQLLFLYLRITLINIYKAKYGIVNIKSRIDRMVQRDFKNSTIS